MTAIQLSLVIPCYNEAKNLADLVSKCRQLTTDPRIEIILVDNGSTDDTPALMRALLEGCPRCRSVRVEHNRGYGFGILAGLEAATGELMGWTHADLQTDPLDVLRGLELFSRHGKQSFVKGRRHGRPLGDVVFTIGMSIFESLLLRTPMWDINAQPTLFSRDFFHTWQHAPHDFSLDLYAYYRAQRAALSIKRFPVRFGARAHGVSHWNINWASKARFIRRTITFSLQLRDKVTP